MVLCMDAYFANAVGLRCKLRYIFTLVEDAKKDNRSHYGRNRCKCVARSVIDAELHSILLVLYYGFVVEDIAQQLLQIWIALEAIEDFRRVLKSLR